LQQSTPFDAGVLLYGCISAFQSQIGKTGASEIFALTFLPRWHSPPTEFEATDSVLQLSGVNKVIMSSPAKSPPDVEQGGVNSGEDPDAQMNQDPHASGLGYEFEVKEQDRWLPIANG
jgi:hypothetical protein